MPERGVTIIKSNLFLRSIGTLFRFIFGLSVVFFCSFGIIGIFSVLSVCDLDDVSHLVSESTSSVVSTIAGISVDGDLIENNNFVINIKKSIYAMESMTSYTFSDATADAKNVFNNAIVDLDIKSISDEFENFSSNVSAIFKRDTIK